MYFVGYSFFRTLADIGQNQIPALVSTVLSFFDQKVSYFFDLFKLSGYVDSGNDFLSFLASVWDSIVGFSQNLITDILGLFGFDLSLKVWQFLLANIGLILGLSIVLRLLNIFD